MKAVLEVTRFCGDPDVVFNVLPLTVALQAKMRLCYNGRSFNGSLPVRPFKFEHAEKAAQMMRPGDYMFTLDMKSGYHQVPLKPTFRKFL